MDCYVYYKSAREHELEIVQQVQLLQKYVKELINIDLHLQRRPGADKGVITWMETYRDIPPVFDAVLCSAKNQTALMSLIQGERHAEYFEDAVLCA